MGVWIAIFVAIGIGEGFISEDAGSTVICVAIASGDRLGSGDGVGYECDCGTTIVGTRIFRSGGVELVLIEVSEQADDKKVKHITLIRTKIRDFQLKTGEILARVGQIILGVR